MRLKPLSWCADVNWVNQFSLSQPYRGRGSGGGGAAYRRSTVYWGPAAKDGTRLNALSRGFLAPGAHGWLGRLITRPDHMIGEAQRLTRSMRIATDDPWLDPPWVVVYPGGYHLSLLSKRLPGHCAAWQIWR